MKKPGRPTTEPRRVTVTLAPQHAEVLDRMAGEAEVTMSAFCAHILERYAVQDTSIMANDVIAQRLEQQAERHAAQLEKRLGDLLAITAIYTIANRRENLLQVRANESTEAARSLGDAGWTHANEVIRQRGWTVTPPEKP